MRGPVLIVVQLFVSLAMAAALMPMAMLAAGPAKDRPIGLAVAAGLTLAAFVVLRLVWRPRRRD